jgi:hypothetical protein
VLEKDQGGGGMNPFTLRIPSTVEKQLRRCRTSLQTSIRLRLDQIVDGASARRPGRKRPLTQGPPMRFYVFEGYRVSYQLDPVTRTIVVLDLRAEAG